MLSAMQRPFGRANLASIPAPTHRRRRDASVVSAPPSAPAPPATGPTVRWRLAIALSSTVLGLGLLTAWRWADLQPEQAGVALMVAVVAFVVSFDLFARQFGFPPHGGGDAGASSDWFSSCDGDGGDGGGD